MVTADWPLHFMDQDTICKHHTKEELADDDARCMLEGKEAHIRKLKKFAENCQKAMAVVHLPFEVIEMRKPHIHSIHLKTSGLQTVAIHLADIKEPTFTKAEAKKHAVCDISSSLFGELSVNSQQIQSRVRAQTCKQLANNLLEHRCCIEHVETFQGGIVDCGLMSHQNRGTQSPQHKRRTLPLLPGEVRTAADRDLFAVPACDLI